MEPCLGRVRTGAPACCALVPPPAEDQREHHHYVGCGDAETTACDRLIASRREPPTHGNALMNNLPDVYFGRIDKNWHPNTQEHFWNSGSFAVMYDNKESFSVEKLDAARTAKDRGDKGWFTVAGFSTPAAVNSLWRMQAAAEKEALVYVDFRGRDGAETVLIGRATGELSLDEVTETDDTVSRQCFYKGMGLTDVRRFPADPVLTAMQPRQSTFVRWDLGQKRVWAMAGLAPLASDVNSLTPGQLEAVCYEYLRHRNSELRLLCRLGGSMRDIDILGWLPSGTRLAAQVTHTSTGGKKLLSKARGLMDNSPPGRRVLFAGREHLKNAGPRLDAECVGLEPVAVEAVFEEVKGHSPVLINAMLTT